MVSSPDKLGNKIVIIPRGKGVKKYFEPRFVIVRPRQTVTWINRDTSPHALTSGEPYLLISTNIIKTGLIRPGKSATLTIPSNTGKIRYFCSLHPSEKGTIVVTSKDENSLSHVERLELLDSVFTFRDASERNAVRSVSERHFHPNTLSEISDPDLVNIDYKMLTIVFWDISGFSALCECLRAYPVLVVEFLRILCKSN